MGIEKIVAVGCMWKDPEPRHLVLDTMVAMKDRDGLKSTIPSGHDQSKAGNRLWLLSESDKLHWQKVDSISFRKEA